MLSQNVQGSFEKQKTGKRPKGVQLSGKCDLTEHQESVGARHRKNPQEGLH